MQLAANALKLKLVSLVLSAVHLATCQKALSLHATLVLSTSQTMFTSDAAALGSISLGQLFVLLEIGKLQNLLFDQAFHLLQ